MSNLEFGFEQEEYDRLVGTESGICTDCGHTQVILSADPIYEFCKECNGDNIMRIEDALDEGIVFIHKLYLEDDDADFEGEF